MTATEVEHTPGAVPGPFEIAVREQGTTTTIAPAGEWDLAEQEATRHAIRAVLACRPECLVLDLGRVTFIDSSAIHVLLDLDKRCTQQNVRLVILPGPRTVQRTLEIVELSADLPFLSQRHV